MLATGGGSPGATASTSTALHDTNIVVTVIRNHGDIVMQDKTVRSVELSNYAL